jgi:hypothetical protein
MFRKQKNIKHCDKNRLRTAEMKYLRWTAGYTLLNQKGNDEILQELHVTPLEDKLCTYRHKWFQHVHRTEDNRPPKQLLNYYSKGRRRPGRPLKRLLDDMTAETETGHLGLNSWLNMMMMKHIWCCYGHKNADKLYGSSAHVTSSLTGSIFKTKPLKC